MKKKIKGFALVTLRGKFITAKQNDIWMLSDKVKSVPCTITYEVKKRKKK